MIPAQHQPFYHPTPALQWKGASPTEVGFNLIGILVLLPFRLIGLTLLVGSFFVLTFFIEYFPFLGSVDLKKQVFKRLLSVYTRFLFLLLGFRVIELVSSSSSSSSRSSPLIVANHISFFDVLYFCRLNPQPTFLAKSSLRRVPILNIWARYLDVVYVEEGGETTALINAWLQQSSSLDDHTCLNRSFHQLVVFSEGTTSNGRFVMPFKTGAFRHNFPIQPCGISYQPLTSAHVIPSWESVPLSYLAFRILITLKHQITVSWLPVVVPDSKPQSPESLTVDQVRRSIAESLRIPLTPYSLNDKQKFHQSILSGQLAWQDHANSLRLESMIRLS